jgi:hypothetical protein
VISLAPTFLTSASSWSRVSPFEITEYLISHPLIAHSIASSM